MKKYDSAMLKLHKPLVVLTGPTAVGKTALSISFAKAIGGEIISADSMQVYRGMDIGSAKIKPSEMDGVSHYLLDVLEPTEECNVEFFKKSADKAIAQIYENGHIPIVTGGTGFYIQALLRDIQFTTEDNSEVRCRLEKEAEEMGAHALYEKLLQVDPAYAKTLHENNVKRVIRALEFQELHGFPFSQHNLQESERISPYLFRYYVLTQDREILYQRIEKRIDQMLDEGLVDEVKTLKNQGLSRDYVSMQGLGYKEILDYLDGVLTFDEAVEVLKRDTRHFAKRQMTWFRREKEVLFFDKGDYTDEAALLQAILMDYKETIEVKLDGTVLS